MIRTSELLKKSEEMASLLPNILSDSYLSTKNIFQGLHSTRFAGKGETFWQFKEYKYGDSINSIDWRKSAGTKKVLVREKENETAKVIYFYYDKSKSMAFTSSKILRTKYYIAALISLTLARIFVRNREHTYLFNEKKKPVKCNVNFNNFNKNFVTEEKKNDLPNHINLKNNSSIIILSDFLYDSNILKNFITKCKNKNINGYLIHVLDPIESSFDIGDNIKLSDLETNNSLIIGNSNSFKKRYQENLNNLKRQLDLISKTEKWPYMLYSTEQDLNKFLIKIINKILINKYKIV